MLISFPGEHISICAGLSVAATLIDNISPSVLCTSLPNERYTMTPRSKLYIVAATDISSRHPIAEKLREQACETTLAGLNPPVSC